MSGYTDYQPLSSKRPKYSTEPSETFPAPQRSESTPNIAIISKTPKTPLPVIKKPEFVFTAEDVERARLYAAELPSLYEAEKAAMKEAFEACRKRDVQRANQLEAERNEATAEYTTKVKLKEALFAQDVARIKEQARVDAQKESERHEEEVAKLRAELDKLTTGTNGVQGCNCASDDSLRQQFLQQGV